MRETWVLKRFVRETGENVASWCVVKHLPSPIVECIRNFIDVAAIRVPICVFFTTKPGVEERRVSVTSGGNLFSEKEEEEEEE